MNTDGPHRRQGVLQRLQEEIGSLGDEQLEMLLGYALALHARDCEDVTVPISSWAVAKGVGLMYDLDDWQLMAMLDGRQTITGAELYDAYSLGKDLHRTTLHDADAWRARHADVIEVG